jgi:lipoprotein-releasing system permease protein
MLTIFGIVQDEELGSIPVEENIEVSGVFNSGYYDFDSSMGYVELPLTEKRSRFFPANTITIGIKLDDRFSDNRMIQAIRNVLPNTATGLQSWREYNKSFFGALRTEKTIMMLLISLIFLVVGINIFHAMRRAIAVKKNDIAVLKACGATNADIRSIFIVDGLSIGIFGAVSGLIMGLVITYNINEIIEFFSLGMRALGSLLESLGLITSVRDYRLFSPAYFYLDSIPVSIGTGEIIFILGIAIASTSMAALLASRRVSEASPSEVLRNE